VAGNLCLVKALTCCFATTRAASNGHQKAMISQYGPSHHVKARHISQVLDHTAICTAFWLEGFALHNIGTHSIRASSAMQLFLNNVSGARIKKIGQWKSATWLSYIHSQILAIALLSTTTLQPAMPQARLTAALSPPQLLRLLSQIRGYPTPYQIGRGHPEDHSTPLQPNNPPVLK
jgi:hypothetical protein